MIDPNEYKYINLDNGSFWSCSWGNQYRLISELTKEEILNAFNDYVNKVEMKFSRIEEILND